MLREPKWERQRCCTRFPSGLSRPRAVFLSRGFRFQTAGKRHPSPAGARGLTVRGVVQEMSYLEVDDAYPRHKPSDAHARAQPRARTPVTHAQTCTRTLSHRHIRTHARKHTQPPTHTHRHARSHALPCTPTPAHALPPSQPAQVGGRYIVLRAGDARAGAAEIVVFQKGRWVQVQTPCSHLGPFPLRPVPT